ncbi:MAG: hypothetical protein HY901_17720 [Deltaproteobacteria bacterium]|nr:hypothetical protein [Deltaproteobacteria bacterium]
MAESTGARSVMNHPPSGIPKYFDGSPYDHAPIAGPAGPESKRLALYQQLAKAHFGEIPEAVTLEELTWLEAFHRERVIAEREERRMHFGAFALVGVLFFILLPSFVASQFVLALALLEVLLLVLLVPYVFVYFGYENRVRAMTLGLFRLIEARAVRAERVAGGEGDP